MPSSRLSSSWPPSSPPAAAARQERCPSSRASRTSRRRAPPPTRRASRSRPGSSVPGIDKKLAFSAEGGFDTPAKRSQMSVDLSSVAELMKSFASSFGGTVTGDLGSPEDWKLDVIQDGDIAYVHFPLLAKQLPGRQDVGQGRRQDALERRRGPAEAVRLARRDRPARHLRPAQGGLRLDRGGRDGRDPRRRDEPLQGDDRHGEAREARSGGAAPDASAASASPAAPRSRSTSGSTRPASPQAGDRPRCD